MELEERLGMGIDSHKYQYVFARLDTFQFASPNEN